jgi:hypothetical protein
MTLAEIIERLNLTVYTQPGDFAAVIPTSGYTSDLLSCVMAGAKHGGVWVTLQSHINIVAVAALLELSAVIITENARPDAPMIARANQEGITLLGTSDPYYLVVGSLWEMGLRAS